MVKSNNLIEMIPTELLKIKLRKFVIVSCLFLLSCNEEITVPTEEILRFTQTFGTQDWDYPTEVINIENGDYLIVGTAYKYNMFYSWLVKLNKSGELIFTKTYDNIGLGAATITAGGNILCTGTFNNKISLAQLNQNGDLAWEKSYNIYSFSQREGAGSIIRLMDNNFVITGWSDSSGNATGPFNGFIQKIDINGLEIWTKLFYSSVIESVTEDYEGNIYITGSKRSDSLTVVDILVCKLNHFGEVLWEKTYGGNSFDNGFSISYSKDNYVFITGRAELDKLILLKIDSDGNAITSYNYTGANSWGTSLVITKGNKIGIAGIKYLGGSPKIIFLKFDTNCNLITEKELNGTSETVRIINTNDRGFAIIGQTISNTFEETDAILFKLDSDGN